MSKQQQLHNPLYRFFQKILHHKHYTLVISLCAALAMVALFYYSWDKGLKPFAKPAYRTWSEIELSHNLRVVTVESSFSAFRYNNIWYGYEYENAKKLADALNMDLQMVVAPSESALIDSLFMGNADLSIWPMSYSVGAKHWFLRPTGPKWQDWQCIATLKQDDTRHSLAIIYESRQWDVFHSDSVRNYFDFSPYLLDSIPADSLSTEQLTDSMIDKKTDAVMLRCNVARLMHDYYPNLIVTDSIPGSCDSVAWMTLLSADTLRFKIDSLSAKLLPQGTPQYTVGLKHSGNDKNTVRKSTYFKMKEGAISPYDVIFRHRAAEHNLDWRLLAAIAFIESNFEHEIVSHKGPLGLMQLMPQTATNYGYTREEALDPDINVELSCRLLESIRNIVEKKCLGITDEDKICFVLTGYNAGIGHLTDAINLADTLGYKTNVWEGNVEHCLRLKSDPHYYRMSVVKSGKFNGAFTINYVNEVLSAYQTFCEKVPRETSVKKKKTTKTNK